MSRKSISPIGGLQSFMFCIGMYFVALFFSIFVCSSIFYAINPKKDVSKDAAAADLKSIEQQKKAYVMK